MKYIDAPDLQAQMVAIVRTLNMDHVDVTRVKCFRSKGSSTKRTLARCHTVGKLMQKAMNMPAHYAIEFLEKFESLSQKDQYKVIIHELMHIPKTFGGGFRQHDYVCEENVERLHARFIALAPDFPELTQEKEENVVSQVPVTQVLPQRRLPRFF